MGGALITRRGGSVRRGSLTAPIANPYRTITDPALVKVRNAVIFAKGDSTDPIAGTNDIVVSIVILDGAASYTYTNSATEAHSFTATYDPDTGAVNVTGRIFLVNNTSDKIPAYDYIIWD